jgi:hypothetical protein
MVAPEQAAAMAQTPVRMIYRWVETGEIHYKEVHGGSLMVCVKSILRQLTSPANRTITDHGQSKT